MEGQHATSVALDFKKLLSLLLQLDERLWPEDSYRLVRHALVHPGFQDASHLAKAVVHQCYARGLASFNKTDHGAYNSREAVLHLEGVSEPTAENPLRPTFVKLAWEIKTVRAWCEDQFQRYGQGQPEEDMLPVSIAGSC